jgi:hypothetical protein
VLVAQIAPGTLLPAQRKGENIECALRVHPDITPSVPLTMYCPAWPNVGLCSGYLCSAPPVCPADGFREIGNGGCRATTKAGKTLKIKTLNPVPNSTDRSSKKYGNVGGAGAKWTLQECQGKCKDHGYCNGIEYNAADQKCSLMSLHATWAGDPHGNSKVVCYDSCAPTPTTTVLPCNSKPCLN